MQNQGPVAAASGAVADELVDDTAWPSDPRGTIYTTDNADDSIYAVTGPFRVGAGAACSWPIRRVTRQRLRPCAPARATRELPRGGRALDGVVSPVALVRPAPQAQGMLAASRSRRPDPARLTDAPAQVVLDAGTFCALRRAIRMSSAADPPAAPMRRRAGPSFVARLRGREPRPRSFPDWRLRCCTPRASPHSGSGGSPSDCGADGRLLRSRPMRPDAYVLSGHGSNAGPTRHQKGGSRGAPAFPEAAPFGTRAGSSADMPRLSTTPYSR